MATYTVDKIEYSSNVYVLQDSGALQLTGGQVTGPVTFGDTIIVDNATINSLVVNGNASFTNNIQANTINGVTVGSSPKFTDTNTEVSTLTLASGSTTGTTLAYGGKYTLTAGSKTVSFTMPASVTNTDEKVKQTNTTTSAAYELLFSYTADNTERTEGARKTSTLTYNPSTKALVTGGTVNGYTLAAASAKGVDTSIASGSSSANLPTSAAVASYVTSNATQAKIVRWSE